jgi:hypothetical protein
VGQFAPAPHAQGANCRLLRVRKAITSHVVTLEGSVFVTANRSFIDRTTNAAFGYVATAHLAPEDQIAVGYGSPIIVCPRQKQLLPQLLLIFSACMGHCPFCA